MRQLRRILLTFATLASLALAAATAALWARSYRYLDQYATLDRDARALMAFASLRGGLQIAKMANAFDAGNEAHWDGTVGWIASPLGGPRDPSAPPLDSWQLFRGGLPERYVRMLGFRLLIRDRAARSPIWSIRIPYWSLGLVSLPLPLVRGMRWWRRRRGRKPGHCPACGYDLRATPHRCPECGGS